MLPSRAGIDARLWAVKGTGNLRIRGQQIIARPSAAGSTTTGRNVHSPRWQSTERSRSGSGPGVGSEGANNRGLPNGSVGTTTESTPMSDLNRGPGKRPDIRTHAHARAHAHVPVSSYRRLSSFSASSPLPHQASTSTVQRTCTADLYRTQPLRSSSFHLLQASSQISGNVVSARTYSSSASAEPATAAFDPETMVASKIDGTALAKSIRERLKAEIAEKQLTNPRYQPCLKIIQGKSQLPRHGCRQRPPANAHSGDTSKISSALT